MPRGCSCPLCPWYKVWKDWCLLTQGAGLSLFLLSSWAQAQPGHIPALWLGGRSSIPYSTAVAVNSEFLNSSEQRRKLELLGPFWLCSRGSSSPLFSSSVCVITLGFCRSLRDNISVPNMLCAGSTSPLWLRWWGSGYWDLWPLKQLDSNVLWGKKKHFLQCSVLWQPSRNAVLLFPKAIWGCKSGRAELETVSKSILVSPREALMVLPKPAPFTFKSKSADEPNCF